MMPGIKIIGKVVLTRRNISGEGAVSTRTTFRKIKEISNNARKEALGIDSRILRIEYNETSTIVHSIGRLRSR